MGELGGNYRLVASAFSPYDGYRFKDWQMSHTGHVTVNQPTEDNLESIKEEQISSSTSIIIKPTEEDLKRDISKCICKRHNEMVKDSVTAERLQEILKEKEEELRSSYDKILEREKAAIKERFDYILLNEQTRASYMLREAHRERQEKIRALQTQLQCKNLAALMYVMCTERRRSRLEKLRIMRGRYLSTILQFMAFIYNFAGGSPESNQYLIDLPKLLKIDAPTEDDPEEDPCEAEEKPEQPADEIPSTAPKPNWWEESDAVDRPFLLYGDMADFSPDQRRQALKTMKQKKTAPRKWKDYAFRSMFLKSRCCNLNQIKDLYVNKLPLPTKFECMNYLNGNGNDKEGIRGSKSVSFCKIITRSWRKYRYTREYGIYSKDHVIHQYQMLHQLVLRQNYLALETPWRSHPPPS
ncbi:hypothetical protein HF086_017226 [Spodoptera exigua]|uniref:Uncharacterized protein n=1 Tax=Spodoptera exigua TaxID=7107 RepID=A0A922MEL7_SPOEX|nr:hypothetical protein HF086_017226 [Spodoptera exigua]